MACCIASLTLVVAWDCEAQRPPVQPMDPRYFRVDFIVPGARPSGLAGAFVAAAQDELASAINPAGMTCLSSPSVSTHQRWSQLVFEEPEGSPEHPDATKRFHSTNFEQSLVTLAYPIKDVAISLFRQVQMDSRFEFEIQQFSSTNSPLPVRRLLAGEGNFPGRRVSLDLELVDEGLALAYAPSNRISFGACGRLSYVRISIIEYLFLDPNLLTGARPRGNSVETTYSITTLDETEVAPSFDLGFLATLSRGRLFVGAVAHIRHKYTFRTDVFLPEYRIESPTGPITFAPELLRDMPFDFSVPDGQALGLYYLATDRLRFALDLNRIEYSDLLDGHSRNAIADDALDATGTYQDPDGEPDLTVDDAYEVHFGIEFIADFPWLGIVPLRAGAFTNPGHRVYAGTNNADLRRLYPQAEDRTYFAFGFGVVPISKFKLDVGLLASEEGTSVTGSAHLEF